MAKAARLASCACKAVARAASGGDSGRPSMKNKDIASQTLRGNCRVITLLEGWSGL